MTENNLLPPPVIETPEKREILKPIKPKFKFSPIFLIIVLSLFFVGTILAAYYYGISKKQPTVEVPVPVLTEPTPIPSEPVPTVIPTISEDVSDFGKITWLSNPIKVPNPDILNKKNLDLENSNGHSFLTDGSTYKVATFSNGASLLVTFISPVGPSSPYIFRIIQNGNNYYLHESLVINKYIKPELDNIFDKSKIKYISYNTLNLLPPDYVMSLDNKVVFTSGLSSYDQFFPKLKNPEKIASSKYGDFYAAYSESYQNSKQVLERQIYLKLADSTLLSYKTESISSSDNHVPYVNISGQENKDAYESGITVKCGLGDATTIIKSNSSILNDKEEVGNVSNNDQKIYQIKNSSNELVKQIYDNYKIGRDYPSGPPVMSIDQFVKEPNHFLAQDKLGDWVVFVNSKYALQAECGKPVIYLYPEKNTEVTVKVGADITKSEPLYPKDGWTVLAHPSGQLDYQDQVYPNLFWEGTGKGYYPNLTNYGFVVAQKDLISTLNSQLRDLGLNAKESADFMEFWTDKLPKAPYVRLTWLGNAEMNQLAPLSVSPRPDTSIRIFLDFAGLDKPIKLISQKLSAPPRRGFTLVEWGGLLIK